jgi:hypothetical protein
MIPALEPSTYIPVPQSTNGSQPSTSQPSTNQASTTQGATQQTISQISSQLSSAVANLPSTPDSALNNTLATISTMIQSLMTMIQNIFQNLPGLGGNNTPPAPTPPPLPAPQPLPGNTLPKPPAVEPPTIVPVDGNKNTAPSDTKATEETGKTKKSRRKRRAKTKGKKGSALKGRGEFLWKPKSEKDGNLAILTPKAYSGKIESVQVLSPDGGQVIAKGRPAGIGNGDREHFRFNQSGGEFPDGSVVLITLTDGSKLQVPIKETSERFTK